MFILKQTPPKSKRNALVYTLRKQGLSMPEIGRHPEIIELTGGTLTRQRILQILKREEQKTA